MNLRVNNQHSKLNPVKIRPQASNRRGWYKVHRADRDTILTHCEGAALSALSVWDALCDIANERKSNQFAATIGIIRTLAGTSRSTTFEALSMLVQLGMIERKQNKIDGKPGALDASTFTLLTQDPPSAENALPQSTKRTTPSPSKIKISRTETLKQKDSGSPGVFPKEIKNEPSVAGPCSGADAQSGPPAGSSWEQDESRF